jgi:hypothetical protein
MRHESSMWFGDVEETGASFRGRVKAKVCTVLRDAEWLTHQTALWCRQPSEVLIQKRMVVGGQLLSHLKHRVHHFPSTRTTEGEMCFLE